MAKDTTYKFGLTIKILVELPKGLFKQCGRAFVYVGKALADLIGHWIQWLKYPWC